MVIIIVMFPFIGLYPKNLLVLFSFIFFGSAAFLSGIVAVYNESKV